MTTTIKILTMLAVLIVAISCDQQEAVFPEDLGGGNQCGPWYAGGSVDEAQEAPVYELAEDATLPCFVWTSVRKDNTDTRLNVGELYLDVADGIETRKAMVLLISGAQCPACGELIAGMMEHKQELDELAVMVALNRGEPALDLVYDLDDAVDVLVEQEGWPTDWYVTNDVENNIDDYQSFPWVAVVRLSDMQVVSLSNSSYHGSNIPDLIDLIETF